jgi:hypothetical protein
LRWRRLSLRRGLQHYHSPTGFNFSYSGSGPAELARHLLWHATGRRELLKRPALYQRFKAEVVAHLPTPWTLTGEVIRRWVAAHDEGDRG